MLQAVSTQQRFRRFGEWCPICGGHAGMKPGRGERCAGFISEDGEYVFCTRPEYAGDLEVNEKTSPATFCHKLYGFCKCGKEHNPKWTGQSSRERRTAEKSQAFGRIVAEYSYVDQHGRLAYQAVRYEPKAFGQRHPDGKGGWNWNMHGVTYVPYKLPELLKASPNETVYIVEGEKDAETLLTHGLTATTNIGGAGKWQATCTPYFKGRRVVIVPDNDEAGEKHAADVVKKLRGVAKEIRVVKLPGLPEKGDVSDWFAAGGTREHLETLCQPPPPLEPGRRFSDIQEKEIEWFWEKWIPRGKITMLDALPDQGKSVLCTALAASASSGAPMPDGASGAVGAVIMVNLEDDAADTVKPRLLAAGADVRQVIDLSLVRTRDENGEVVERPFQIPRDLPLLEEQITKHGVALVCLDPLMAILDFSLKSCSDQDVRQALTPLARLLERTRCACVIVRHFNKGSSDNALIRGAGSMGIVGAARSQLFVTPDPDNPERHILALGKHNLSAGCANLIYRIVSDSFGRPKIQWEGTSSHSTAELLSPTKPSVGRQEILRILRKTAKPLSALEIVEQATSLSYEQARQLLSRMSKAGTIVSPSRGLYTLSQPSQPSHLSQSSQSSQSSNNNTTNPPFFACVSDCDRQENCHNHDTALQANSDTIVTGVTGVTGVTRPKTDLPPKQQGDLGDGVSQTPPRLNGHLPQKAVVDVREHTATLGEGSLPLTHTNGSQEPPVEETERRQRWPEVLIASQVDVQEKDEGKPDEAVLVPSTVDLFEVAAVCEECKIRYPLPAFVPVGDFNVPENENAPDEVPPDPPWMSQLYGYRGKWTQVPRVTFQEQMIKKLCDSGRARGDAETIVLLAMADPSLAGIAHLWKKNSQSYSSKMQEALWCMVSQRAAEWAGADIFD